ncbi:hypothetical protein HDU67_002949 [Dinochytrium kinnereticum]|nr:hypothetical protein HDU67_002949 [Dinochytrium kinnereticum]
MFSPNLRTAARGDKQVRQNSSLASLPTSRQNSEEDTPTVRQRINEARKSGFLDLSSLSLTGLPADALKLEDITALLLGNNKLTAVPSNLANNFPRLVYLDLSRNKITSIPASLAELEELEILDLSANEGLRGSMVPTGFGPIRDHVAVFVDDEDAGGVAGSVENGTDMTDNLGMDEENDAGNEDDDEEEEEDSGPAKRRRDFVEDVALEARRFFRRLESLEEYEELDSFFRRRLAARDPGFIKYLLRRYGDDADDGDGSDGDEDAESSVAKRKEMKGQMEFARKEKDRYVKGERKAGRKVKANLMGNDY